MLIKRRNFIQLMGLAALPLPAWLEQLIAGTSFIPGSPEWKGDGVQRPLSTAWEEV